MEQLLCHQYNLAALMLADARQIDRATLALHTANVQRDRLPRRRLASTDILRQTLPRITCRCRRCMGRRTCSTGVCGRKWRRALAGGCS